MTPLVNMVSNFNAVMAGSRDAEGALMTVKVYSIATVASILVLIVLSLFIQFTKLRMS